jgi:hypothetical protein
MLVLVPHALPCVAWHPGRGTTEKARELLMAHQTPAKMLWALQFGPPDAWCARTSRPLEPSCLARSLECSAPPVVRRRTKHFLSSGDSLPFGWFSLSSGGSLSAVWVVLSRLGGSLSRRRVNRGWKRALSDATRVNCVATYQCTPMGC